MKNFHIFTIHFGPPKRGQPLYKGQDAWSQGVLYMEDPLTTVHVRKIANVVTSVSKIIYKYTSHVQYASSGPMYSVAMVFAIIFLSYGLA